MKFCKRCGHELTRCICHDPDLFTCVCLFCDREFKSQDGPLEDTCPKCAHEQDRAYPESYRYAEFDRPYALSCGPTGYAALKASIRAFDRAQNALNDQLLASVRGRR